MSRIGKNPIPVPQGVEVNIEGLRISVKGVLGVLERSLPDFLRLEKSGDFINVSVEDATNRNQKIQWGLWRTLISNMVLGVSSGFSKRLELNGVGYRAQIMGDKLILNVGFSHPVEFACPIGINVEVSGNIITVSGINKEMVGETAASIRRIKKPEPYKGKGIRYVGEVIRRKAGKLVKG